MVEISGKPQVVQQRTESELWFPREASAEMEVLFCSDPKPRSVKWSWGQFVLSEGKAFFNYITVNE